MKKMTFLLAVIFAFGTKNIEAQDISGSKVPTVVKAAFVKKYPEAKKISWEMEKGNYEANWGGKSGEDNSAMFTPDGAFLEIVLAIPIAQLPAPVAGYVKTHYKGAEIKEAGKITDAAGKLTYEAEIKGKDLIFDEAGNFIKED